MKERRKKTGGSPTMFTKLKELSAWIGLFSAVIVPLYMLYTWNTTQIIEKHDDKIIIKKAKIDIKVLNENLMALDNENSIQHTTLNNSIVKIEKSVKSIDLKINQLILQKKYSEIEQVNGGKLVFPEKVVRK